MREKKTVGDYIKERNGVGKKEGVVSRESKSFLWVNPRVEIWLDFYYYYY